jgi:hypothetical protein
MALDEPALVAKGEMPFLPPAAPPKPAVSAPPVFDAKAMVDATKRNKVENPVYGHMPTGTPEGRAGVEAARARMRRKRRRNKIFGWVLTIVFFAVAGGVGFALYTMHQDDQDEQQEQQSASAAADDAADDAADEESPGALTPLGEQEQVIEALDDLNSGITPSAGGLVGAVEDARDVVGQINEQSTASQSLLLADVLPPDIAAVATELQTLNGLTRYMIVVDDAVRAAPLTSPGWLARLQALPQAPELSPGLTLVPAVGAGEIAIGLQVDGDQVTRLVVLGSDPEIRVDL